MTALKKKSEGKHRYPTVRTEETCEEQLRRMCKEIADDITDGLKIDDTSGQETVSQWMEGVYDIEWITFQDHSYKAARLLVAGGGPNIWVNTLNSSVDGYWGNDRVQWIYSDNIGLDEYLEELYASSK